MSTTVIAMLLALSLANVCFSFPVTTTTEQQTTEAGNQTQREDTDDGGLLGKIIGGSVGGGIAFVAAVCAGGYVGYHFRSKICNCHCCHLKPHYGNGDNADRSNDACTNGPAPMYLSTQNLATDNSLAVVSTSHAGVVVPLSRASTSSSMSSYVREALTGVQDAGLNPRGVLFTKNAMDVYM